MRDLREQFERLRAALASRYRIVREIGRGGMALVYLADDLKHERRVAVKVFRPELAAALGPERFLREIQIAAVLAHPHILPLHDSGEADGFLFFVMPYVEGETLRDRLTRQGHLPVAEAVRIVGEIADGLEARTAKASSTGTSSPKTFCSWAGTRSSPISASRRRFTPPAGRAHADRILGRHPAVHEP